MEVPDKLIRNIMDIIKIKGFYIGIAGDPSVGIPNSTWELRNDFYFDNQEEFDEFKKKLRLFFEDYCGEVASVTTIDEYEKMLIEEDKEYFRQFPVRYLIRDRDFGTVYKQADSRASYSGDLGTGIHTELPSWIPENGDISTEVIKSTDPKYKDILEMEAKRLQDHIATTEAITKQARKNLEIIKKELSLGLNNGK